MSGYLSFVLFVLGLVLIIKGSDWFISSSIKIAERLRIPSIIIGATLVSFGTTLPEFMVSVSSSFRGNSDIALGNALGSIAFNTGVIMALVMLFAQLHMQTRRKLFSRGVLIIVLLLFLFLNALFVGSIMRVVGLVLLLILCVYLYQNVRDIRNNNALGVDSGGALHRQDTAIQIAVFFILGLFLTILGANLMVSSGQVIAKIIGVPDLVIGLIMTAIGTSLPELFTALTAIAKRAYGITLGNILGANILNILFVTGTSAAIRTITLQQDWVSFHLPYIIFICCFILLFSFERICRFQKLIALLLFGVYLQYVVLTI